MHPIYNADLRKQLLGEMGSALIQSYLVNKGYVCWAPWDIFHRSCDLLAKPILSEPNMTCDVTHIQVKCKVPWVTEKAQSFKPEQLEHYKQCDRIYFICAPVKGKFEERDIWKGNIYSANPNEIVIRIKTTKSGREMSLIDLDQPALKLEFTIRNRQCLDMMKELITQDD